MEKYIFLFTLSPVQSFIAQARKTQDLYAGSRILSELTKAAATEAKDNQGIHLVFPQNTEGAASFPNRFIGTIENASKDLQTIGQAIEKVVIDKFKEFANDVLERVKLSKPNGFEEQINNHLDINWLFHPIKTTYADAYKEIEPLMASLKNVRFISNTHPEAGRKCSLDGELNALFRGQHTTNSQLKKQAIPVSTGAWLNANEGLSAVNLVKRTYEAQKFPSTAEVALSFHIEHLDVVPKINYGIYKSMFSKDRFDEQLCYKENLTQKYLEQNGYKDVLDKYPLAKLQELRSNAFGDKELQKYYAVIAFDGDKMGELLSGETRKDKSGDLEVFQGKVSGLLMLFSQFIYDTLDKKKVHVIYTGGDDFLGFVNLHDLFEVVETLRIQFDEQVNKVLKEDLEADKPFTFSMGIAIAHYKTPLSIVLKTARDMETKAKNDGKRNAFAIAALKHSGESHEAYFKWELTENKGLPKWNTLKKLVDYFQNDCSETFVRSLDKEFYLFQQKDKIKIERRKIKEEIVQNESEKDVQKHYYLFPELKRLTLRSMNENSKTDPTVIAEDVWQFFVYDTIIDEYVFYAQNALDAIKVALFLKKETKVDKKVKNGN
jgi:CRISPR-associated protein Cmr2